MNHSPISKFVTQEPRPLPLILLADVSGSMGVDGKIQSLNYAMREMIGSLKEESDLRAEIHIAVIRFGGTSSVWLPIGPARKASWNDLPAEGATPMGYAFTIAHELIEDKKIIPSRAYRPTIVLVSDGQPTDEWQRPLDLLLKGERSSKAFRMALAIGADADENVLQAFIANPEERVFRADEASQIRKFFKFVTMSLTARSRSINPNHKLPNTSESWDL